MKIVVQDNRRFVLRFDQGEDVVEGLVDFATKQGSKAAAFHGIGSCRELELGYFNAHLKEYRRKPMFEDMEIISLNGNVSLLDGKPAVHMHGMFGRTDFSVAGGHVFKLVVQATCEIFLIQMEGEMSRKKSEEIGLNLLD